MGLYRAVLPEGSFFGLRHKPMQIVTYQCPCRQVWIEQATEWLEDQGIEWKSIALGWGLLYAKFNDIDTLVMFKLTFGDTILGQCHH